MTNERLLKLLQEKAEVTRRSAYNFAEYAGYKTISAIPNDDATFAAKLFAEYQTLLKVIRMLTDDKYAEDIYKIYLPEDETNETTA